MSSTSPPRLPIYFRSIDGPNTIKRLSNPAYDILTKIGKEITETIKPKAIIVFPAHWQDGPNRVLINTAKNADMLYDFHGFPQHYYQYKSPSIDSPEIAEKVAVLLEGKGIEVARVNRGLDHSVWAGFVAAFDPESNPLNIPLIQVSLFRTEDTEQHYRMGQALESLRDEGIMIIGAGMAVHNLLDFRGMRMSGEVETMPYALTFEEALYQAISSNPADRQERMQELIKRSDARKAHPTPEHLLPMFIVAGAVGNDVGERVFGYADRSLNWAQYRFGEVGGGR